MPLSMNLRYRCDHFATNARKPLGLADFVSLLCLSRLFVANFHNRERNSLEYRKNQLRRSIMRSYNYQSVRFIYRSFLTLSITLPILDIFACKSLCLSEYFFTKSLICSLHKSTELLALVFNVCSFSTYIYIFIYNI